jgi:hypothetical protein
LVLKNKRRLMMKKLLTYLIILLFAAGPAAAKDYAVTKQAGDYTVNVKMDKNPPVSGDNRMEITIQDKSGAYVTDAIVSIEYAMPAMSGMPAMNYRSTAQLKDKAYLATVNFSMSGAWNVSIKITRAEKTQSVKLNVDVS